MEGYRIIGDQTFATVFADKADVEVGAGAQIESVTNHPAFYGQKIAIMPDVHQGVGCVIGFTASLGAMVIPCLIGVDIGCGVMSFPLTDAPIDFAGFDRVVRKAVPSGFAVRYSSHPHLRALYEAFGLGQNFPEFMFAVFAVSERVGCNPERALLSLGTLGGGNHFIEIDRSDKTGMQWLTIHSGSRNFGLRIANFHQDIAKRRHPEAGPLAWLEGEESEAYLRDMRLAQVYARLNRLAMADEILRAWSGESLIEDVGPQQIESVHNFIGYDDIIRKGAISARAGQSVIIPWNMRDGLILGKGLGNLDWNDSAPHGAGRRMGRKDAKRRLNVEDFAATMRDAGVWSSCIGADTLDESPDAYKPHETVEVWLSETVEVVDHLRPVYNFKAGEE